MCSRAGRLKPPNAPEICGGDGYAQSLPSRAADGGNSGRSGRSGYDRPRAAIRATRGAESERKLAIMRALVQACATWQIDS